MDLFSDLKIGAMQEEGKRDLSAIDTFDWYNARALEKLDEKTKDFIMRQRRLLMDLRNEDERMRFVFEYIKEVYEKNVQALSGSRGG